MPEQSLNDRLGRYRDPVTEAYDFIEKGDFPTRLREINEELALTPYDKPYRIENWNQEDLVMYVGGDKELYR